jgi:hypothetical protein
MCRDKQELKLCTQTRRQCPQNSVRHLLQLQAGLPVTAAEPNSP